MKKRNIYIVLFSISIFGLAVIQYRYLQIGLNLAKVQFNTKMGTATRAIQLGLHDKNQLTYLVGSALQKDTSFFQLSMDSIEDASSHFLNDFIREKLGKEGIATDFAYKLVSRDSAYYLRSPVLYNEQDHINTYPMTLSGYLPQLLGKSVRLELKFKDLNTYFLSQLNGLTLPSLLFMLSIIAAVIWALRTYYWQSNLLQTTGDFINNLTHELKTPVFSIALATKILGEDSTQKQRALLEIIRQQTDRLSKHIDKVLELGRMESANNGFILTYVDFNPYLHRLASEFAALIVLEKVKFEYTLQPGEYRIKAEVFHLENAIKNVLDNAKKYARDPHIRLNSRISGNFLEIEVADNGVGLDRKEQKRIFQKFYRVAGGDVHDVKGYGLGLTYVKQVISKHKGSISINSEKGIGTKVTLKIPLYHGKQEI